MRREAVVLQRQEAEHSGSSCRRSRGRAVPTEQRTNLTQPHVDAAQREAEQGSRQPRPAESDTLSSVEAWNHRHLSAVSAHSSCRSRHLLPVVVRALHPLLHNAVCIICARAHSMMLSTPEQSGGDDYTDDFDFEPPSPSASPSTNVAMTVPTTAAAISSKASSVTSAPSSSPSSSPASAPSPSPSSRKGGRPSPASVSVSPSLQRRIAATRSKTTPQRSLPSSAAYNETLSSFTLLSVQEKTERPTAARQAASADSDSSTASSLSLSSLALSQHPALHKLGLESRWDPSPFVPQPPSLPHKQPLHAASRSSEADKEAKRVVSAWEETEQRRRLPPAPCVLLRPPRSEVQTRMSDVVMRTRQLRRKTRQHSSSMGGGAPAVRQTPAARHSRAGSEQTTAEQGEERELVKADRLTTLQLAGAEEGIRKTVGKTRTRGAAVERQA